MLLDRLKQETAEDHRMLERSLDLLNPRMPVEVYMRVLECFHDFVAPWEAAVMAHLPDRLRPFFAPRCKTALLRADLLELGVAVRARPAPMPRLESVPRLLGSLYVMEGATLGGEILAPRLAQRYGFCASAGCRFFRPYGGHAASRWQAFRELITAEVPPAAFDEAVSGAQETFACLQAHFDASLECA